MSNFYHGVKASQVATSISTPVIAKSGIHFIVGTSPIHTINGKTNEIVIANNYAEAVKQLGFNDDFEKYTICEEIYTAFKLYNVSPVIFVNVLDPNKHFTETAPEDYTLKSGIVKLPFETLKDSLKVKGYTDNVLNSDAYEIGVDFDVLYTEDSLKLEILEGGKITDENAILNIGFNKIDVSKVTSGDIIGGYDINTRKNTGLELINYVYPKFNLIPDIIIAPKWSQNSEVAAVMAGKAENINGIFRGKAIIDVDTKEVKTYSETIEWKKKNNITQPSQILVFPKVKLGEKIFNYSTHLAGLITKTDNDANLGNNSPCESASNKTLQIDGTVLSDGEELILDLEQANYLNANGIVTVNNFSGSFVSWGNYTACYPSNTDVKDYFYCVSRMFDWIGNTIILSCWNKVDKKLSNALVESIVQSISIWFNGLKSAGIICGGRIEYLKEENSAIDLLAGKLKFHIYIAPPVPAQEIEFLIEYDVSYLENIA